MTSSLADFNMSTIVHECLKCTKYYSSKPSLRYHIKTKHSLREYACNIDQCTREFYYPSQLKEHMKLHSGEKTAQCTVCLKWYRNTAALTKHTRIHTGEKPFECMICADRFSLRRDLVIHSRIHTGEPGIICEICDKEFARKDGLTKHRYTHTGEKPYACQWEECYFQASRWDALREHMHKHTIPQVDDNSD